MSRTSSAGGRRYAYTACSLHPDADRPGMPYVMFMSAGGGVLQGDCYRIGLDCGPGTTVHFSSQTVTRLYRMEHDYATTTWWCAMASRGDVTLRCEAATEVRRPASGLRGPVEKVQ
ncbi:urease accessory protein UreD [Sphaerisporangium rubeum]